jgi:nucleotide-binding universal stress UspA family protein
MKANKILVCIDFQDQSIIALNQCFDLAHFLKAEIVLLYVIESTDIFFRKTQSNLDTAKDEVTEKLNQLIDIEKKDTGLKFSTIVKIGKVSDCVVETAKEIKARFVVMGKNGTTQGIRKFLGSNTSKVISESDFPVISIKGKHSIGYKDIVLPLDLTKTTREQVASAISFSKYFGSHIHIVTVHSVGIIYQATNLYNRIKKIEKEFHCNGVQCTHKLFRRGELRDYNYVLNYSKEINADLIMIMTHQEGRVRDYYIGAFAHHIINESEIPVLSLTPSIEEVSESLVEAIIDPFDLF